MRRLRGIVVLALAGSCGGAGGGAAKPVAPRPLTAKDIVQRSSAAIVRIEAGTDKVGTGFILDKLGLVATNLHVVAGESAIKVRLYDGSQYAVLQIAGIDPDRDLALLRIKPAKDLPVLKLGDSDVMTAGDQIVTIGNPLGVFDFSVTEGLISQVRPVCGRADIAAKRCKQELTVLQISAAISPGSSGGPLFNQSGEVVGVTTAITSGQNLNLAVPGNYLRAVVAQHATISPDQFAKETKLVEEGGGGGGAGDDDGVRIERRVPRHDVAVFDGCKLDDIEDVVHQIGEAIENGAPLYNEGKHEACYRIYEGTAVRYEHDAACAGVRTAFGDGLLRASGMKSYKEKAWAMRDTFDGLIDVAHRWAEKHPQAMPPPGTLPRKPKSKPRT
jgi:serine protease Do